MKTPARRKHSSLEDVTPISANPFAKVSMMCILFSNSHVLPRDCVYVGCSVIFLSASEAYFIMNGFRDEHFQTAGVVFSYFAGFGV